MASIEEELDAALLAVAILKAENARYIERIEELTSGLSKLKAQADRHWEALESDAEWDYTGWSEKFR